MTLVLMSSSPSCGKHIKVNSFLGMSAVRKVVEATKFETFIKQLADEFKNFYVPVSIRTTIGLGQKGSEMVPQGCAR